MRHVVVLPGVPREMKPMMEETVLPWLRRAARRRGATSLRTFQTFGVTRVGSRRAGGGRRSIRPRDGSSFRASFPEVSVRVVVHGEPDVGGERLASASATRLRAAIGSYCYGEGAVTMEETVGRLLREQALTVATAESCTGGLVGAPPDATCPGSSAYVRGGVVAYANEAKRAPARRRAATLEAHGAVSEETARDGGRRAAALGADIAVSTTGVAGPDGGAAREAGRDRVLRTRVGGRVRSAARYQLWGTRDWVKLLASQVALEWIRRHLLGLPVRELPLFRAIGVKWLASSADQRDQLEGEVRPSFIPTRCGPASGSRVRGRFLAVEHAGLTDTTPSRRAPSDPRAPPPPRGGGGSILEASSGSPVAGGRSMLALVASPIVPPDALHSVRALTSGRAVASGHRFRHDFS